MSGDAARVALSSEGGTLERDTPAVNVATWKWLVPSIAYALLVGMVGITTKFVLEDLPWDALFVWASVAYLAIACALVVVMKVRLQLTRGVFYAAISGVFAASGLIFLFLALEHGQAGQVVPITSAYPVVTAGFAALVLAERVSPARMIGTLLVVAGVALLGSE